MAGHTLLIVGAGFSKPFGGPLLDEVLLPQFTVGSEADSGAIAALAALADERDEDGTPTGMEPAFTRLWEERYTGRTIDVEGRTWTASDLVRELRIHLSSIASKVRLDFRRPIASKLEKFFKDLVRDSRSLSVVSFNYDTLVEDCLDRAGLLYSYGSRKVLRYVDEGRERRLDKYDPDVEVLKLHGSVNWGVCRGCKEAPVHSDLINVLGGVYGLRRNASCRFCNKRYLESSIVPPVETKGTGLQPFEEFWKRAHRAARRSREVIVIGYSLPPADSQAYALVQSIPGPPMRPRVRIVCGTGRVPWSYEQIFKRRFTNLGCRFEDFLAP